MTQRPERHSVQTIALSEEKSEGFGCVGFHWLVLIHVRRHFVYAGALHVSNEYPQGSRDQSLRSVRSGQHVDNAYSNCASCRGTSTGPRQVGCPNSLDRKCHAHVPEPLFRAGLVRIPGGTRTFAIDIRPPDLPKVASCRAFGRS